MEEKDIRETLDEVLEEEITVKKVKKQKNDKYEKLNEDYNKALADLAHWKNEYYRVYADTQNLRTSIEKDHRNAMKYRIEGVVNDLLPVLDGFHLALNMPATTKELQNYLVGFQYIYKNFVNVLEGSGVHQVEVKVGDKFNEARMQAVETVEADGEENTIVKVLANGYVLHDRLIRPAMVVVSKKKIETEEIVDETDNKEEVNLA